MRLARFLRWTDSSAGRRRPRVLQDCKGAPSSAKRSPRTKLRRSSSHGLRATNASRRHGKNLPCSHWRCLESVSNVSMSAPCRRWCHLYEPVVHSPNGYERSPNSHGPAPHQTQNRIAPDLTTRLAFDKARLQHRSPDAVNPLGYLKRTVQCVLAGHAWPRCNRRRHLLARQRQFVLIAPARLCQPISLGDACTAALTSQVVAGAHQNSHTVVEMCAPPRTRRPAPS